MPAAIFTGSITTDTLTVTSVASGSLAVGQILQDETGALNKTVITGPGTGTGGAGTYIVSPNQSVLSEAMTALTPPLMIPLSPVPAQTINNVVLGGQSCRLKVYVKTIQVPDVSEIPTNPPPFITINPIFIDVYVNDVLIVGGILMLNNVKIIRDAYLGFIGDLSITDTNQVSPGDPEISGLGSRYLLLYWPDA